MKILNREGWAEAQDFFSAESPRNFLDQPIQTTHPHLNLHIAAAAISTTTHPGKDRINSRIHININWEERVEKR